MAADLLPQVELAAIKLRLLNSILPLLSPDLAPPPPPSAKRKADSEELSPPAATVGLGLGAQNEEVLAKRARLSPPPPTASAKPIPAHVSELKATLHAPTPELRSAAFYGGRLSDGLAVPPSPHLAGARALVPQNWKEQFPSERLYKLSNLYREKALDMKRLGDKVARENRVPKAHLHATVVLADALLLYVFAFWCQDQAAKKCHTSNWSTIFGLLAFVKGGADKAGAAVVVAICLRIEAHVVHLLSANEQKHLAFRGGQYISSLSPSLHPPPSLPVPTDSSNRSPQSQSSQKGSPPETLKPPSPPDPAAHDLIKSYTKAGTELFRYQKAWEDSALSLASPRFLAYATPGVWSVAMATTGEVEATGMVLPVKPWGFAWPVDLGRTMAIPHSVVFMRAVLEEWATGEGLQYEAEMVAEATSY